ncbi:prickle-like protein 4 [Pleurodeles waltl]|uniref:prickle-like protein 4 n=1 Tax=Pleurodeles waltl TaxID=8319 RepID=UPI003709768E
MSEMSPAWQQGPRTSAREQPSNTRHPSSSDSDSGCPQEEVPSIASDSTPAQVALTSLSMKDATTLPTSRCRHRIRTLLCQLPPQDSDEQYCTALAEEERGQLQQFYIQRRLQSLGQGSVQPMNAVHAGNLCERCGQRIPRGALAVLAAGLKGQSSWHPSCFICCTCEEPLFDFIYFHHHGQIYCGRHHAELFRPRCASCDQLIFTKELTEAEGWHWHLGHFCCTDCGITLGGQRYVMKGGLPYCCACFDSTHAETCHTCGHMISLDCERVTYQGQHWHAHACCFRCQRCHRSLLGREFLPYGGMLLCSATCKALPYPSSGSDSSDSAFLSAPSPVSKRSLRGSGGARSAHFTQVKPTECKWKNENKKADRVKAKEAQSSAIISASMHLESSHFHSGAEKSMEAPTTEAPPLGTQAPDGGSSSSGPDTHLSGQEHDDVSCSSVSSACNKAPVTACSTAERTQVDMQPKQDSPAQKALPSLSSTSNPKNLYLEDTTARHKSFLGPGLPESDMQPTAEDSKTSASTILQPYKEQQHRSNSIRASNRGQIWMNKIPSKEMYKAPDNMVAQDQSLPGKALSSHAGTRQEESRCPTCSSSSDSEQEGFFLGRPIPSFMLGGDSDSEGTERLHYKISPKSKHCTLS